MPNSTPKNSLPRYALRHPDGRWLYYLPEPTPRPGERTGLYADGKPLHRLTPRADSRGNWYVADHHAERITAVYQPQPTVVAHKLRDRSALSERYPAELAPGDFRDRAHTSEEYWNLYEHVTENQPPVEHVHEGPFLVLEGRQPPAPDEPQWRAELPHELTQRPEYRHLFPGYIPGLRERLEVLIKAMPKVDHVFNGYQGKPGLHVGVRVPFDQPRTRFLPNIGRRGQRLKSGRTVTATVTRRMDLPVPAAVHGPNYETALTEWHQQIAYWTSQVEEASVAACSSCNGYGFVPHGATDHPSTARPDPS